jgi:hypothetical protein
MSDYRDEFERRLVDASERLTRAELDKPQRRRVVSRRALPYAAVGFLCAGTAVAATQPWSPLLGDPTHPEFAPVPTTSGPPQSQLEALGVLRRPATDTDRDTAVTTALRFLGPATTGIRTAYIRRVGTTAAGAPAIVIPAERWERGQGPPITDPVCLVLADPLVSAAAKNCWSTKAIKSGEASGSYGSAIYGLVPDGVAQVVATFAPTTTIGAPHAADDGHISASVVDNFFTIGGAAVHADGDGTIPVRPVRLEGLDADGKVVVRLRP